MFDGETIFVNTYFGLGELIYIKIDSNDFNEDDNFYELNDLILDKKKLTLFKIPFYNKHNPFFLMKKYREILYDKISNIHVCSNKSDFNPNFILFEEDCDFLKLLNEVATSPITKERVEAVNTKHFYCPEILRLLEESNLHLRKIILKKDL
jgi:hypothetical protein